MYISPLIICTNDNGWLRKKNKQKNCGVKKKTKKKKTDFEGRGGGGGGGAGFITWTVNMIKFKNYTWLHVPFVGY